MCRTRQEIIDTDTTLQDLVLFIKQYEEELSKGKNGKIHFELAQARASLDTRIAQIQSTEDVMEKFEEAGNKREEIHTELDGKLTICEDNLKCLKDSFDLHVEEHKLYPPLKKEIAIKPGRTLTSLLGLIITVYTVLFFLSHILLYSTGFDVLLSIWVKNIFGL